MGIHEIPAAEVYSVLRSHPEGLSDGEARQRLSFHGPNVLQAPARTPLLLRFLAKFTHFFALLLWVAAAIAFAAHRLGPGEGMQFLGGAIVAVIVINAVFSFWQEYRAERELEALARMLPVSVLVRRGNREVQVDAGLLVPGELVFLAEGGRVPADVRILECHGLQVNNAPLTGESRPLDRNSEPTQGVERAEAANLAFAGTTVVRGRGLGIVFATGMQTEFGKVAHMAGRVRAEATPLEQEVARLSRHLAAIAVVVGVVFFAFGVVLGRGFWQNFLFALGVIVALVPEGLLPTVTLSLAAAARRMAARKVLVRTLSAVETLGCATVICTDKTGTLTQNIMAARRLWIGGEWLDAGTVSAAHASPPRLIRFFRAAVLASDAEASRPGQWTGDPTESALVAAAVNAIDPGAVRREHPRIDEIPFDSIRKRMTTLNRRPDGRVSAFLKGAPEVVAERCDLWANEEGDGSMTAETREAILASAREMAQGAMRVLAVAEKNDLGEGAGIPEDGFTFLGLVGMEDPPRPEVSGAVSVCREAGVRVIMVTGDSAATARAVADRVGLGDGGTIRVFTPGDLQGAGSLRRAVETPGAVFARMTPAHKLAIVSALKRMGEIVAVTGDGVNDAPALKKADIGVAMGMAGTEAAKEASDVVLLDDNFASIVAGIEEGRAVYANIKKFLSYILTSNVPEVVPYLAFAIFSIPLPLTVIQILAVDLGTDMLPALALGREKPEPDVMRRPPRPRTERLLSWPLLSRAYLLLGPIEATAGLAGYFWVLAAGGWTWGMSLAPSDSLYMQATTMCLTAIVVTQVANGLTSRSETTPVRRIGFLGNRLLLWGMACEVALQAAIVYHPALNAVFGTHPISLAGWLFLVPFAVFLLVLNEARKEIAFRAGSA